MELHLQLLGEERPDDGSCRVRVASDSAFMLPTEIQDGGGREGRVRTEGR